MAQMAAEAAALAADPERAEQVRRARKICNCKTVDLGTIEDAIHAHALTTVDGIRQQTNASGGCGACSIRLDEILATMPPVSAPMLVAAE
jgi:nitrogenase molybdenum-cofactor synthesis protein NifE